MLDLFIQVPAIIRKRLSRRCKEVYETVRAHVSAEEADEGTQEQVRPPLLTRISSGSETLCRAPVNRSLRPLHGPSS